MSTKTVWVDAPDIEQQTWLLKDGSVVQTPPIERTATNKRLRVKGTTTSTGIRQLDKLMLEAVKRIADDQGTETWMKVEAPERDRLNATINGGFNSDVWSQALTLHLLQDRSNNSFSDRSTAVWTYKAQGLPLYAYVFVDMQSGYNTNLFVNTRVVTRSTHPFDNDSDATYWTGFSMGSWDRMAYQIPYSGPERDAVDKMHESDVHPFGPDTADRASINRHNFSGQPRRAVTHMLRQCEFINQLSGITLPDFRDPVNPQWITFDFLETNYSGAFAQELRDFHQTGPIMDRIKEHYGALMADLELLGVVLQSRPDEDAFEKAIGGDFIDLEVAVKPVDLNDDGFALDKRHTVYLNFPSGTITVGCTQHGDADAKAQWEIDKFKYEATGELTELLAYARGFHEVPDRKKARKIARSRAAENDD